jgi:hypothetical protein
VLVECVNSIGDVGASTRSSDRKQAQGGRRCAGLGPWPAIHRPRVLGDQGDTPEPRAGRTLPRAVRQPIPGLIAGVGSRAYDRLPAARRARHCVVGCRRDAPVRVAKAGRIAPGRLRHAQRAPYGISGPQPRVAVGSSTRTCRWRRAGKGPVSLGARARCVG